MSKPTDLMDKNRVKRPSRMRGKLGIRPVKPKKGQSSPYGKHGKGWGESCRTLSGEVCPEEGAEVSRSHSSRWSNDHPGEARRNLTDRAIVAERTRR